MGSDERSFGEFSVLMLATTVPPNESSGTPEFVLDLARGVGRHCQVTLLAPRVRGARLRTVVEGVEIIRFPYFLRRWESLADGAILPNLKARPWLLAQVPFFMISYVIGALVLALLRRPDAVNAHWIVPGGIPALVLHRVLGIPYVLTAHGVDVHALNDPFDAALKRMVVRHARAVCVVSEELARAVTAYGGSVSAKLQVIPMGMALDRFEVQATRDMEAGPLVFVGRLAEKKGVDVVLRAIRDLGDMRLDIVGDGPDRRSLERLAQELGVSGRTRFKGTQPRTKVVEALAEARAVVIPSVVAPGGDKEGTPVVLAEAMAMGAPIIASRLGGLEENIRDGETGVLVEPASVDDLRDALRDLVRCPEVFRQYGSNARLWIQGSRLDLRRTVDEYMQVLGESTGAEASNRG